VLYVRYTVVEHLNDANLILRSACHVFDARKLKKNQLTVKLLIIAPGVYLCTWQKPLGI